jgi:hypothetical protein
MTKKLKKIILIIVALIVIVVGGCLLGLRIYTSYIFKKEHNLVLLQSTENNKQLYILGTIHDAHLRKSSNYSLAHIQSVIDTVNPDILLVEVRPETIERYGALDGPTEMLFAWAYAKDKGIEVHGVDWWKVNWPNNPRDYIIFDNILEAMRGKTKVLVMLGASHRIDQTKYFKKAGYEQKKIDSFSYYFDNVGENYFEYPKTFIEEYLKRTEYYKNGIMEEIKERFPHERRDAIYARFSHPSSRSESEIENILKEIITQKKLYWQDYQ